MNAVSGEAHKAFRYGKTSGPVRQVIGTMQASISEADEEAGADRGVAAGQTELPGKRDSIRKLIAKRAYELWENQGRPHGCDLNHWREAEREIMECVASDNR